MPRATISTEAERKELKSAPPDGYVELRRMPYGDWLKRQEMAMKMTVSGGGRGQGRQAMSGEVAMANMAVTQFEFQRCIVDHNLEDADGNKLDFNGNAALQQLDPKIGNEIGQYIMEMHEFDLGNSSNGSDTP
jgi:hypothetical protein